MSSAAWSMCERGNNADELRALSEARPQSVFERVAAEIEVEVVPWNGGIPRRTSLWDVLKYPTAYEVPTLKVVNSPEIEPNWAEGRFYLRRPGMQRR